MKAFITGASSGIGRDIARQLAALGYELILVARRENRLCELANSLETNCRIIPCDLSSADACIKLCETLENENIDVAINNAGFGVFGKFTATDLQEELSMIDVNITAMHIFTKYFLRKFSEKNSGYILNTASSAAFCPGPLFSSYYASKAYVLRLTQAISCELKKENKNVYIGALCPGPVATEFDSVAHVKFSINNISSEYVAKYAVKQMFKRKTVIIPGALMKITSFFQKILPSSFTANMVYGIQHKKEG